MFVRRIFITVVAENEEQSGTLRTADWKNTNRSLADYSWEIGRLLIEDRQIISSRLADYAYSYQYIADWKTMKTRLEN